MTLEAGLLSVIWHRLYGSAEARGEGITAVPTSSLPPSLPPAVADVARAGVGGAALAADTESIFFHYASFAAPSGAGSVATHAAEPSELLVTAWAWRRLMTDIGVVARSADRAEMAAKPGVIAAERQSELIFSVRLRATAGESRPPASPLSRIHRPFLPFPFSQTCTRGAAARAGVLHAVGEHKGLTKETFLWAIARVAIWMAPACVCTANGEDGTIASDSSIGVSLLLSNLTALLEPAQRLKVSMGDGASLLEPATVEVFSRGEEMLRDIFIHFATDSRAPSVHSEGPVISLRAVMRALNELSIMPGVVSHSVAFGSFLAVNPAGTALTFPGFLELVGRLADAGFANVPAYPTTAARLMELLQRVSLAPAYERIATAERVRRTGRTAARPIPGADELLSEATSAPGAHARHVTAFSSVANASTGAAPTASVLAETGSSVYWLPSASADTASAIPEDTPSAPLSVAALATSTAPALTDVGRAARLRSAALVGTLDDAAAHGGPVSPKDVEGVEALLLFFSGAGRALKAAHRGAGASPDSLSDAPRSARRLDDFAASPADAAPTAEQRARSALFVPPPPSRPGSRSPSKSPLPHFPGAAALELTAAQIPLPTHSAFAAPQRTKETPVPSLPTEPPSSSPVRARAARATPPRAVDAGYTIANSARSVDGSASSVAAASVAGSASGLVATPASALAGFVTEHLAAESLAARALKDHLYGVPVAIPVPSIGKAAAARTRGELSLSAAGLEPPRETLQNATLPLRARSLSPRGFRAGGGAAATALSAFVPFAGASLDGRDVTTRTSRAFFVDAAVVDACAQHYAPLLPRLKPIFLLYARLQDPLNRGVLHPSNFVALLRDIDALDGRVTTELVDFELGVMARDKSVTHRSAVAVASAAAGAAAAHHASAPPPGVALSSGGRLKLATAAALANLANSHGPSADEPLRAGVATGGGDERFAVGGGGGGAGRAGLDLDDFLEALARVSELVRRAQRLDGRAAGDASPKSHSSVASAGAHAGAHVTSPLGAHAARASVAISFFGDFLARRVLPLLAIAAAEDAAGVLASSPHVLDALDPHSALLHRIFAFYVSNAVCVPPVPHHTPCAHFHRTPLSPPLSQGRPRRRDVADAVRELARARWRRRARRAHAEPRARADLRPRPRRQRHHVGRARARAIALRRGARAGPPALARVLPGAVPRLRAHADARLAERRRIRLLWRGAARGHGGRHRRRCRRTGRRARRRARVPPRARLPRGARAPRARRLRLDDAQRRAHDSRVQGHGARRVACGGPRRAPDGGGRPLPRPHARRRARADGVGARGGAARRGRRRVGRASHEPARAPGDAAQRRRRARVAAAARRRRRRRRV
jgi:hypothetical protein